MAFVWRAVSEVLTFAERRPVAFVWKCVCESFRLILEGLYLLESRQNLFRVGDTRTKGNVHFGEISGQGGASNVQDVVLARLHLVEEERRQFCVASDA